MIGANCRSGCKTRNHLSYSECLKDGAPRVTLRATPRNSWDRELNLYGSARAQGIQPASTKTADIIKALELSNASGVAYNAAVHAPPIGT